MRKATKNCRMYKQVNDLFVERIFNAAYLCVRGG